MTRFSFWQTVWRETRKSQRRMRITIAFCRALNIVNETLAKKMAGDGEGCTALFEVKVVGAETKEQAKILAKSVICLQPDQGSHLRP